MLISLSVADAAVGAVDAAAAAAPDVAAGVVRDGTSGSIDASPTAAAELEGGAAASDGAEALAALALARRSFPQIATRGIKPSTVRRCSPRLACATLS